MKTISNMFAVNFKTLIVIICIALVSSVATSVAAKGKPGPGSDPATIFIQYFGAITGGVSCDNKLNADSTILGCNHWGGFTFKDPILGFLADHDVCFPSVDENGTTEGTIQLLLNRDFSAEAVFRFWGRDANDSNDVLYVLRAYAGGWIGSFPPEYDAGATTMSSDSWTLSAANKRQEKDAGDCLALPQQQAADAPIGVGVTRTTP